MSDLISFYYVSDKVPSKVITGVTGTCAREDCQLSARIQETTLVSTSSVYDKNGVLQIQDSNRFTAKICCSKCWKGWLVNQNGTVLEKAER